ncbi:MAG: hypothetical protein IE887_06840 [Campylobacterales bacterium]|nr:hypothetical protein [Campylobacterales bacterium]
MGNLNKSIYLIAVTAFAFFIINEVFSFSLDSKKKEKLAIYKQDANILDNLTKTQLENVKILSNLLAKNELPFTGD